MYTLHICEETMLTIKSCVRGSRTCELKVIKSNAESGKMLNIKSKLSTITAEMPFSRAPKHRPALMVQLRCQQHNSAVLWLCLLFITVWAFERLLQTANISLPIIPYYIMKTISRCFLYVARDSHNYGTGCNNKRNCLQRFKKH